MGQIRLRTTDQKLTGNYATKANNAGISTAFLTWLHWMTEAWFSESIEINLLH